MASDAQKRRFAIIRALADNRAFWDRAIETIRSHHIAWLSEQRPTVVRST
jgi:hypothetical protein